MNEDTSRAFSLITTFILCILIWIGIYFTNKYSSQVSRYEQYKVSVEKVMDKIENDSITKSFEFYEYLSNKKLVESHE